ncbi:MULTISPECIES: ADP-ribosylglycohydrolase family protein [Streptomyces]|uniref:ADP-ribosylglycohydrolase family protein n=1 Tax=Streptomyces sudanensis TaxID=436397 RepID=A0ABY4TLI1_9ACTN|nr:MULTISPECIES: ADP-ribosylglycohydrolase family protein [Streptomyces]URN17860.1 ADP-ribosylglycohydrolase family protein [Streptomyces sudanensis]
MTDGTGDARPRRTAAEGAATGALLGLALGDAMGLPTEFIDIPRITSWYGPWRDLPLPAPARVTDDTQMTLAVGRALRTATAGGPLAPEGFARALREEFVAWARSPENDRAPGRTCLVACGLLAADLPWQDAAQIGSKGCGADMRVAPVGLVPGLTGGQRAGAAQLQAALTHGHPTALAASDLTAHAVHLLARGAEPLGLVGLLRSYAYENRSRYHEAWLGDLWTRSQDPSPRHFAERGWDECLAVLERVAAALRTADPETDPCLLTGEGWVAEEALATALLCFLMFPREPLTALRRAACTSGDSDSIACLTGAFAGAHLGVAAWPGEWAERVEYRRDLLVLGALWDA